MSSTPEPAGYPGNPSLPKEVREKILSTFRHTLNLYREGKADDCTIGCDFILKMDPRFAPARQLMEKVKNPAAGIDVGTLEAIVAATPTRQERVASVDVDKLLVRAAESLNARDFDAAIASAEQVLQALPGNRDAGAILEKARQRRDAGPQLEGARQRALMALDAHRVAEARAALEKMRTIDADHPSIALLESRIASASEAAEVGESTNPGLSLAPDDPPAAEPPTAFTPPAPEPLDSGGLGDLSLDSLSLDEPSSAVVPPPAFAAGEPSTGPLSLKDFRDSAPAPSGSDVIEIGGPPNMWGPDPGEAEAVATPDGYPAAFSMGAEGVHEPAAAPEPPSPRQEIEGLLARGDEAARGGNRQQAIEVWSRIFLIDINNSEAVGRIEKARQEMAEGNRRVAESLKLGREKFEAGDFTAAREAFLQVLAFDESDATARSFLDRIEQELARPSAGLDLSRKTPASDILAEEMAASAEPVMGRSQTHELEELEESAEPASEKPATAKTRKGPADKRFVLALAGALVLALAVGAYFFLRKAPGPAAAANAGGGASLQRATELFQEGKIPETIEELKKIGPTHPDYARAQKLLASLSKQGDSGEALADGSPADAAGGEKPADAGPSEDVLGRRATAEKALEEKRYIDALKGFAAVSSSFQTDPSFTTSMGVASEKVAELTPAVKLYNEGEYETAVPILWRIFQADRSNQDARSYLLRCYYNQGVSQLQNGLYPKAVESFSEVVAIDPADPQAARHKKFAERYLRGDLDLMGRIYVRHVQQRP
jgi:tetratricopeptide (TPR) repeat protein